MVYEKNDDESLDWILVKTIQKGLNKKLFAIVNDKRNKIADRRKAFDELVFKEADACAQLWEKYARLVKKMKFKLIRTCYNHRIHADEQIEDYDQKAYLRLLWVVCTIRMGEIEHLKDEWVIYQAYLGNLLTMNRDMIHEYLVRVGNETQIYGCNSKDDTHTSEVTNVDKHYTAMFHSSGLEEGLIEEFDKTLFWDSWKLTQNRMTKQQNEIVESLIKGKKPTEIRAKLGITPKGFKEEVEDVKRKFSAMYRVLGKGRGEVGPNGEPITFTQVVNRWR